MRRVVRGGATTVGAAARPELIEQPPSVPFQDLCGEGTRHLGHDVDPVRHRRDGRDVELVECCTPVLSYAGEFEAQAARVIVGVHEPAGPVGHDGHGPVVAVAVLAGDERVEHEVAHEHPEAVEAGAPLVHRWADPVQYSSGVLDRVAAPVPTSPVVVLDEALEQHAAVVSLDNAVGLDVARNQPIRRCPSRQPDRRGGNTHGLADDVDEQLSPVLPLPSSVFGDHGLPQP
jgi:hypothetical protein